tara:strand:+ start:565 stop:1599 length:1035 start_codon:yes stop_codon:yes gene_type:complete
MIKRKNLEKYYISDQSSIFELIKKINLNGEGFCLIINKQKNVIGILTDGDVRRLLLKKIDLNEKIFKLKKKNFNYILQKNIFKKNKLHKFSKQIPVLDKNKKLKAIIIRSQIKQLNHNNSVFIFAGGKGSRMGKISKKIPKPMLKINNKPILENIINSFKKNGFINFIISTKHLSSKITKHFGDGSIVDVNINYTKEKKFLGTAGSLSLINKKEVKENLFVTNGDLYGNLNYSNMLKIHEKRKNDLTICARLHTIDIPYGLINTDGISNYLNEKPKLSYLVNSGIYIIKKKILKIVKKNRYLDMNDLINLVKKKKFKVGIYSLYEPVYDIGDLKRYKKVKKLFK